MDGNGRIINKDIKPKSYPLTEEDMWGMLITFKNMFLKHYKIGFSKFMYLDEQNNKNVKFNVFQTFIDKDTLIIELIIPYFSREQLNISVSELVNKNRHEKITKLVVSGSLPAYHTNKIIYDSYYIPLDFTQEFKLITRLLHVDQITSKLENGVLSIEIPIIKNVESKKSAEIKID